MKTNLTFTICTFASILPPLDSAVRCDSTTHPLPNYTPVMKVPVVWNVTLRSTKVRAFQEILLPPLTTMIMEAKRSYVTSEHFYQTTRSHIPQIFNTEHVRQGCSLNYITEANCVSSFPDPITNRAKSCSKPHLILAYTGVQFQLLNLLFSLLIISINLSEH